MSGAASSPRLHLVTGEQGAGKTMFCRVLVAAARAAHPGLVAAGVLSPKVVVGAEATAIDVVDVASGLRRRLATRREQAGADGPATIRWQFDADALAWGDAVLRSAVPCDLLVVDELGPLEFERGEGWQSGLAVVDGAAYGAAAVVVRPQLLDRARSRWPRAHPIRIVEATQAVALARATAAELKLGPTRRA